MSEAVMAESSSSPYTNSINFYERMSHLQGELQGYENQQYQLQEEFQRLCTQGPSLSSSIYHHQPSSNTVFLPGVTTSRSQNSTTSPTHPGNHSGRNDDNSDIRRRARNQEILEKLQQLETNSSIYAARSERLRIMKAEYEALVRKYSSNRKWISGSSASQVDGNDSGNGGGGPSHKSFTSTGVNTDISGPIKAISLPTDMLSVDILYSKRSEEIDASGRLKGSSEGLTGVRESTDSLRDVEEKASLVGRIKTLPTFLDISSTSESDLQGSLHLQASRIPHHDAFDDTSIDTTSQSVVPAAKSRGSNYMLNISTDGSLSESLSSQIFKSTQPARNLKSEKPDTTGESNLRLSSEVSDDSRIQDKDKPVHTSTPRKPAETNGNTKDDEFEGSFSSHISKTDEGLDDSILDSVQNKTPESLPRDDSELLHITEVDEEDEEEEGTSELRNDSVGLAYSGQEETGERDNEKLREAREEIGTWRFQKDSEGRRLSNADPEFSWANKFAASASKLELLKKEEPSQVSPKKASSPVTEHAGISAEKKDEPENNIEKSPKEITGRDQQVDRKERAKLQIERNLVEMTVPASKDEKAGNNKKENSRDLGGSSSFMGSSSKQKSTGGSAGNDRKKVRLKLDYDDSESEHSTAEPPQGGLSRTDLLATSKRPADDDFDDFFDT